MVIRDHRMIRLLLLLSLAITGGVLHAAEGDIYELQNHSNLRKGPDSSYESAGIAKDGDQAVELETKGKWIKVRMTASGDVGWLYAFSLERMSSASVVAEDEQDSLMPADVVVADALNGQDASVETTVADTVEPREVQPETDEPRFVDGAVSRQTVALEQEAVVAIKEGDITVSSELNGHAVTDRDTEQAAPLPVSVAQTERKPVSQGKVVVKSRAQHVVELDALDDVLIAAVYADVPPPEQPNLETVEAAVVAPDADELIISKNGQNVVENDALGETVAEAAVEMPAIQSSEVEQSSPVPLEADVASAPSDELVVSKNGQNVIEDDALSETVAEAAVEMPAIQSSEVEQSSPVPLETDVASVPSDELVVSKNGQNIVEADVFSESAGTQQAEISKPVMPAAEKEMAVAETEPEQRIAVADAFSIETTADTEPVSGLYQVVKTTTIRTGPGNLNDVLGWAGSGARVEAVEQQGAWLKVRMQESGRSGWVDASAVERVPADSAVAMAEPVTAQIQAKSQAQVQAKPQIQPKPQRKPAPPVAEQATVVAVKPVASVPAVVQPEPEVGMPGKSLFMFSRKANLRAGPDVKYDTVTWAGEGSYATELDRKGDWNRVQMQVSKRIGWVYKSSLNLVRAGIARPASSVRTVQVVEEPATSSLISSSKKTTENLFAFKRTSNLRAGPGKQFDVVAWGGRNETAAVIKQKGDWSRVRMTMSGRVGWVFNTLLASTGQIATTVAVATTPATAVSTKVQGGDTYQVLRTEPLRSDAIQFSELTGWVSKDESVTLLEQRDSWMRIQSQDDGQKTGWITAKYLRPIASITASKASAPVMNKRNVVSYRNRISKGETFNFSYTALEQALYRVPVEEIHIRMDEDDHKALFRKGIYDKSAFDIRLKAGRRNLSGRIKVLGSSTRIFKKKSLLIKLDKESGRWYGHRRIALRAMSSDKALMREWMAWKMMAALGMKVPEVHFTRVSFNRGQKSGLYLSIEWMGSEFLTANGLDANGEFYQPSDAAYCGDLNSSDRMDECFDKITPRDNNYSNLQAMATAVSSASVHDMDKVLARYFEDESVINWVLVNALTTNGDTYNKNYWLYYHPVDRKWTVIPWDFNLTFGRTYDQYSDKDFKIFNDNFQYYYPPDVGASNPLKDKTLRNAKLRARLEAKIKHILGLEPNGPEDTFGWFSPTVMHARIGNLAAVVGKEVYKDTFLSYGEGEFTKTYESLMHYVTAHDHFLNTKLFGKFDWVPVDPNAPIVKVPLPEDLYGQGFIEAGSESIHMIDQGWGYFVARLNLDKPLQSKAEFKVHVEGGKVPNLLPPGQSARRCIERSWLLTTFAPKLSVTGNLMVEYIQENSQRTEVPVTIHEELLELWVLEDHRWKPLKTEVNEYSNTLTAKDVHLKSGHDLRFVACSPF